MLLADVLIPPVPGVDFLYLGLPLGLLVAALVTAASIGLFVVLRRPGARGS